MAAREKIAFARALKLFKDAAHRVPAYKDFLRKAKINPDKIETQADFLHIPPTDKSNYMSVYPLRALSWDGTLSGSTFLSLSSGSTGIPFYWPRGERQNEQNGELFSRVYENIFETKKGTTLFVDMFSLGAWIAGLEFYNAAKFAADCGSDLTIFTPSFDKALTIATLKKIAPSYDRIILAGYPPFIKDVIDTGTAEGFDWKKHDMRLFTAGESFSEIWRDYVLELINEKDVFSHIVSLYGMAETGIVAHETPLSIFVRRKSKDIPELDRLFAYEGSAAALYQYDSMARYFEVGEENTLVLTSDSGLPLIRYNTRDQGGILPHADILKAVAPLPKRQEKLLNARPWQLPFVYLYGRRDLSLSFYALMIYVENMKYCLETYPKARQLSGLFIMRVSHNRKLDQEFEITIELARGVAPQRAMTTSLAAHVVRTLPKVNTEYAKLSSALGKRVWPKVTLVPYGTLNTMPGKKHRWVKRA
jgi:phenylacetate-CoA ligase